MSAVSYMAGCGCISCWQFDSLPGFIKKQLANMLVLKMQVSQ